MISSKQAASVFSRTACLDGKCCCSRWRLTVDHGSFIPSRLSSP